MGNLWFSQHGELGSPVRVLSPSLPQHHLQLGAAVHLHRRFPGHPQTEPCVSIPPQMPSPPHFGPSPRAPCPGAGWLVPAPGRIDGVPAAPASPGGLCGASPLSGKPSIRAGIQAAAPPVWEGGDSGVGCVGLPAGTLSLVTPGRGGFAWSRCDNSGTGTTMVALVLPHTVACAGPPARVGGVIWDWVCWGRGG